MHMARLFIFYGDEVNASIIFQLRLGDSLEKWTDTDVLDKCFGHHFHIVCKIHFLPADREVHIQQPFYLDLCIWIHEQTSILTVFTLVRKSYALR